jgi:hypothetical protein
MTRGTLLLLAALSVHPRVASCDEPPPSVCVNALEQVLTLQDDRAVYKQLPNDKRHYLKDAERPAELARIEKIAAGSCSADPKVRASQQADAARLHGARSPECAFERDTLAQMEKPGSRDPKDEVARQRARVAQECPTVPMSDVWLLQMVWARN